MLLHQHPSVHRSAAPCTTPAAEPVNWDDLRFFLQVVRDRSLTTAARQLGVTQSTVGRRLAVLEARLGARLLRRTREGYVCTPAGEAIRERVERIDSETQSIERMIGGLDRRVSGTVRVAAPVLLATHQLSPLTATLRAHYPDLTLELASCNQPLDASLAGADMAVQLRPFACPDLVVRRVGRLALGFYASLDYLRRRGEPDCHSGCAGHDLLALTPSIETQGEAEWIAADAWQAHIAVRTDCRETQLWANLCGGGIALLPCFRADERPGLVRLRTRTPPPVAEIWVAVQPENRGVPRVRAVLDAVADAFRRDVEQPGEAARETASAA